MKIKLILFYPIILLIYSIYSYSQTAPNLVLSSNAYFWQFQQAAWQLGYHQRSLSVLIYTILIVLAFGLYGYILQLVKVNKLTTKQLVGLFGLCSFVLMGSYPALSNDVFNYLMNAKIMAFYHQSPYLHAAWDFPKDPWLNFMMNIHTPTPYGIIWTGIGYVVYQLTGGDLQFGMLGFRLLALLAVSITGYTIYTLTAKKTRNFRLAFFILNPLVLLEAIGTMHNDITMMGILMIGLLFWHRYFQRQPMVAVWGLLIVWIISVYTKLTTIILPFVSLFYFGIRKWFGKVNLADLGALAMIAAMFVDGAKRFYPWYLLWAFSLAPFGRSQIVRRVMLAFTVSGMLSYLFFLESGEYSPLMGQRRIILLFFIPTLTFVVLVGKQLLNRRQIL